MSDQFSLLCNWSALQSRQQRGEGCQVQSAYGMRLMALLSLLTSGLCGLAADPL